MALVGSLQDAVTWWQANPWAGRALAVTIVWLVTFAFVRFNGRLFRMLDERTKAFDLHPRTLNRLDRTADAFAVVLAVLLTLAMMGVTGALWGALTALGVAGIIIGFAARDVFANLFAGIVIIAEHPFMPGDAIEVAGVGGTVKTVRLRSTILTTWDGRQVTLPNMKFIDNSVTNFSANPTRRVDAQVAILHESDAVAAMRLLKEVATAYPHHDAAKGVDVRVNELRDYAVVLEVRFWVPSEKFVEARTHAFVETTRRFQASHIDLAVPVRRTLTVSGAAAVVPDVPPAGVVTVGEK